MLGACDPAIAAAYPSNRQISLPLIKFALAHKNMKYEFKALIDSGADISIFPMDVAELLEIDLRHASTFSVKGINGQNINCKLNEVTMMFDRHTFNLTVGFSTAATGARAFGAAGIIGHRGFFDQFIVSFNYKAQYFEVKKPFRLN